MTDPEKLAKDPNISVITARLFELILQLPAIDHRGKMWRHADENRKLGRDDFAQLAKSRLQPRLLRTDGRRGHVQKPGSPQRIEHPIGVADGKDQRNSVAFADDIRRVAARE